MAGGEVADVLIIIITCGGSRLLQTVKYNHFLYYVNTSVNRKSPENRIFLKFRRIHEHIVIHVIVDRDGCVSNDLWQGPPEAR